MFEFVGKVRKTSKFGHYMKSHRLGNFYPERATAAVDTLYSIQH
jgi:hypothetical protein